MTNSINKMAGKNSAERNGTPGRPRSTTKLRPMKVPNNTTTYINSIATPPRSKSISIPNGNSKTEAHHQHQGNSTIITKQRLTPSPTAVSTTTPPAHSKTSFGSSPSRTSPGLMAGHFAGGKWTEPPSPASLPKPPQHWTQLIFNNNCNSKYANGKPQQQTDIASQLKVLLNVQA